MTLTSLHRRVLQTSCVPLALGAGATIVNAQTPDWTAVNAAAAPPARINHAMAYDSLHGVTVLFGGHGNTGLNDTWTWSSSGGWTRRLVNGPTERSHHSMAFDAARGVVVLYGGGNSSETWEWNSAGAGSWTRRALTGPTARTSHSMVFDAARGNCVLFGGGGVVGAFSDETWTWDGSTWTRRLVPGPSARNNAPMAYDAARAVVVLFGGGTNDGSSNGETWEWDGAAWTQRAVTGPLPRVDHTMVYDAARSRCVIYGGSISNGRRNETWEWDGNTWTETGLSALPGARVAHAMVYDSAQQQTLMFAGGPSVGRPDSSFWAYSVECDRPVFTRHPLNQQARRGAQASFLMTATGGGTPAYLWQWLPDGALAWIDVQAGANVDPLSGDLAFQVVNDSHTAFLLTIQTIGITRAQFRGVIRTACAQVTTSHAAISVCAADFFCDGMLNSQDFFGFLTAFFELDAAADFNADGEINSQDLFDFLVAFFMGC